MTTETTYAGSFIAGAQHSNAGDPLEVVNPADGRPFASVATATAADVDAAVNAASNAQKSWSNLAVSKRGEILGRAAHHVEGHLDELIPLLTREQGKTLRDSKIEITKAIDTLMHYVGLSKSLRGAHTPNLDPGVEGYVLRRPTRRGRRDRALELPDHAAVQQARAGADRRQHRRGQAGRDHAPDHAALRRAAGRGRAARGHVQRGDRAGLRGRRRPGHSPAHRKIAFTGSTPVGEQIMAKAARGTKRVTLELGGSDPMIICDDADLAAAASAASMGRFYNCGQACLAIKRVYVFESVADEVIEAITAKAKRLKVGRGDAEGTQMGPMHTDAQRSEVAGQVARSLKAGGTLRAGGGPPDDPDLQDGFFYAPTVVTDPPHDAPMATEEVFGPALPIWRVTDLDEAIERANGSPFGLGSSVWTKDLTRAREAANRIEAGYTWINSRTKVYDELPFGGWKSSGYGKEHGEEAFDFYTETKSVVLGAG